MIIGFFSLAFFIRANEPEKQLETVPNRDLNETEKKFVGKWSGSRAGYQWEIHRKADRTFEIAFIEPDPDRFLEKFQNYAVGVWWIEGKDYKFEWTQWWGDEGDFEGLMIEVVDTIEKDRVITLTDDDEDPKNIEVKVEKFKLSAWKHKPVKKKAEETTTAPKKQLEGKENLKNK